MKPNVVVITRFAMYVGQELCSFCLQEVREYFMTLMVDRRGSQMSQGLKRYLIGRGRGMEETLSP
jgi:hypothetical protein